MSELNLKFLKTKHKKIDGFLKEKKEKQIIKNRIERIKRYNQKRAEKKAHYKDYAWWADFSGETYYKNYSTTTLGGLYDQYEIITNGKTKNEH